MNLNYIYYLFNMALMIFYRKSKLQQYIKTKQKNIIMFLPLSIKNKNILTKFSNTYK